MAQLQACIALELDSGGCTTHEQTSTLLQEPAAWDLPGIVQTRKTRVQPLLGLKS